MAYCGPRGIELDAFLQWSERSQRAALDWMVYESRRCQGCGTHPDDWAEEQYPFHAHARECKGCKARQQLGATIGADERGVFPVLDAGPASACPQCTADFDD